MTEAEWWGATEPDKPLDWLFFDARAADRKLRLFSVACCEPVRPMVEVAPYLKYLDAAEAHADGLLGAAERRRHLRLNRPRRWRSGELANTRSNAVFNAQLACLDTLSGAVTDRDRRNYTDAGAAYQYALPYPVCVSDRVTVARTLSEPDFVAARIGEHLRQVRLLHDIFGPLPFREMTVDPRWLTADVVTLTNGIYDEKAFDRMPILADALQDAGCDNDEVLNHCRAEMWEHVRGCWVVDLLLGRPWRETS
jgi:hypothetical protein